MYRTLPTSERVSRANDRSTDTIITVMNGIVSRIAFPCRYIYHEDDLHHHVPPIWKDHFGWPSPDQRDRSYQPHHPPENWEHVIVEPIHLIDEGYVSPMIAFDNPPDGFQWSTEIDDYIIRLTLDISCDAADVDEIKFPFALYVVGNITDNNGNQHAARDLVTRGDIRILPAIHANS